MQIYVWKSSCEINLIVVCIVCFCCKIFKITWIKRDIHNALIVSANEIDSIYDDVSWQTLLNATTLEFAILRRAKAYYVNFWSNEEIEPGKTLEIIDVLFRNCRRTNRLIANKIIACIMDSRHYPSSAISSRDNSRKSIRVRYTSWLIGSNVLHNRIITTLNLQACTHGTLHVHMHCAHVESLLPSQPLVSSSKTLSTSWVGFGR